MNSLIYKYLILDAFAVIVSDKEAYWTVTVLIFMPRAVILNSHPTIRLSIHLLLLQFSISKTKFPNCFHCHTCSWSYVLVLCGLCALAAVMFRLCFLKLRFRGADFGNDQKTKLKCCKHKYLFTRNMDSLFLNII